MPPPSGCGKLRHYPPWSYRGAGDCGGAGVFSSRRGRRISGVVDYPRIPDSLVCIGVYFCKAHQTSLCSYALVRASGAGRETGATEMRDRPKHTTDPTMRAVAESLKKYHGCHGCGEERRPRIVSGKLTCPECGSERIVCIERPKAPPASGIGPPAAPDETNRA